jgi:hypothetical protein
MIRTCSCLLLTLMLLEERHFLFDEITFNHSCARMQQSRKPSTSIRDARLIVCWYPGFACFFMFLGFWFLGLGFFLGFAGFAGFAG